MTYAQPRFLLAAVVLVFLSGCLPNDMPAYVNGGKTVVAVASGKLWTYDVATGKATPHSLPGEWLLESARAMGDQIFVMCRRPGAAGKPDERRWQVFDATKNEFVDGADGLHAEPLRTLPASYQGQKCIFTTVSWKPAAQEKVPYQVFALPDMKDLGTVNLNEVLPAGGFWWVMVTVEKEGDAGKLDLGPVEVFDEAGKQVLVIASEEARKLKYTYGSGDARTKQGGRVGYARINAEEKVLLLAFGYRQQMTFGVFDITNGKFLWGGEAEYPLRGNPVVKRNEIWSLGRGKMGAQLTLVRHTAGDDPNTGKQDVILTCAEKGVECNASPDGTQFVVSGSANGKPALLFIPIKEGVTEKDVKVVELSAP